jgi:type I restriction enzyme, S subunit
MTTIVDPEKTPAEFKHSGIEWIGHIPAHWDVLPLRRVTCRVATGRTPPSTNMDYFTDGELNWFTPGDFSTGIELHESARKVTTEAIEDGVCTLFPKGTVFLVGIGATLGKAAVNTTAGSANQQINAILPGNNTDPYFMAYFLQGFRTEVRVTSNGNTLGILNQDGTKSLLMPVPPLDAQRRIAGFLDEKTARIDGLIEKKRALLDRLAEKRQALITRAVTKGLNPDAPLKPSGIDWLGEIPAHWEIAPLRWYLRTASGEGLRNVDIADERTETDYAPVLGGNGTMGFTDATNSEKAILVIGRVGAQCGNVHPIEETSPISLPHSRLTA